MKEVSFNSQVLAAFGFSQQLSQSGKPIDNPLESARDFYIRMNVMAGEPDPVFQVEDRSIESSDGKFAIRIYRPSDRNDLPVTIYFHGGWFFMGGLETHDRPLRALANASKSVVIAVDYRLAPEHPFPAAVNDAYNALLWVVNNVVGLGVDSSQIALAGDSAGGNLAAVTARKAIKNGMTQVKYQALIYPVTDTSFSTDSWREFADGPVVTKNSAQQAWGMYVTNDQDLQNPDVAPLFAGDLKGLPPALVIVGEYDPLRDEGLAYAEKLRKAGVSVQEHLYHGMPHGFFQMGGYIDAGKDAIVEVGNAISKALSNGKSV